MGRIPNHYLKRGRRGSGHGQLPSGCPARRIDHVFGGKAFWQADMPTKALSPAPAPATIGKEEAPIGKGKAPVIVTKG